MSKSKSLCCNAETKLGYFNPDQRPDIFGIPVKNGFIVNARQGTYCTKCNKLCDYRIGKVEYYTHGMKKEKDSKKNTEPRFTKPSGDELVGIALLFNDGVLDTEKIVPMVAMAQFIIDRLYENGSVMIPSISESGESSCEG